MEVGMSGKFILGITSLDQQINVDELPILGEIPAWLSGSLIFNGPGKFEVNGQDFGHWFDGLAMLRRFTFVNGKISYANRFLESRGYKGAMQTGEISYEGFGTDFHPSFFQRLSLLYSTKQFSNNANINVMKHGDRALALTETPTAIEFHPQTLATIGEFSFDDHIPATTTTAHPHHDFEKNITFNITQKFSLSSSYNIFSLPARSKRRHLLVSHPVRSPAYMHSFGLTENFIILVENPLVVNPLRFLWGGKPFIENYQWMPERGTRFLVYRKSDGNIVAISESEPFFAFHYINAFERNDEVVIDISAYPDSSVVDELYLHHLREAKRRHIPKLDFRRYRVPLRDSRVTHEVIYNQPFELPGINYQSKNSKDYHFAYALGQNQEKPFDFLNQLVKVDVQKGDVMTWFADGCYPGEPVFVPAPAAINEDDGLILSVVLDSNIENSFLLILDASSFTEIGRAIVPHALPFGFHGQFFEDL
jgi:carotenoid cleavage dioxygenase-like enzyme